MLVQYPRQALILKPKLRMLELLKQQEKRCPNAVRIALCLMTIPGLQAENKRIFPITGMFLHEAPQSPVL